MSKTVRLSSAERDERCIVHRQVLLSSQLIAHAVSSSHAFALFASGVMWFARLFRETCQEPAFAQRDPPEGKRANSRQW